MDLKVSAKCDICQTLYDIKKSLLHYLGCKGNHIICRECLLPMIQYSTEIYCLLDNTKILLQNKTEDDFPKVKELKVESRVEDPCMDHREKVPAEILCLECQRRICKSCKQNHSKHSTIPISDIATKKVEIMNTLRKQIESTDEILMKREEEINRSKKEKMKALDSEQKLCMEVIEKLFNKRKANLEKQFDELSQANNMQEDLDAWKTDVKNKFNGLARNNRTDQATLLELWKIQDNVSNLTPKISKGTNKIHVFNDKVNKISFGYAEKIIEFAQTKVFVESNAVDQKQENGEKKNQEPQQDLRGRGRSRYQGNHDEPRPQSPKRKSSIKANPRYSNNLADKEEEKHEKIGNKNIRFEKIDDKNQAVAINQHVNEEHKNHKEDEISAAKDYLTQKKIILHVQNSNHSLILETPYKKGLVNTSLTEIKELFLNKTPSLLKIIKEINFECVFIESSGAAPLGEFLGSLPFLTSLRLAILKSEKTTEADVETIQKSFSKLKNLAKITFSLKKWKLLNDATTARIIDRICDISSLKTLEIDFSNGYNITNKSIESALNHLTRLFGLKKLRLSFQSCSELNEDCKEPIENFSVIMENIENIEIDLRGCKNWRAGIKTANLNVKTGFIK